MSNAMFYVWLLLGSFTLMTILFFIAEAEVKNLRRQMAHKKEEDKFEELREMIKTEVQILRRDMVDSERALEDQIGHVWKDIHLINVKIKDKSPKGR